MARGRCAAQAYGRRYAFSSLRPALTDLLVLCTVSVFFPARVRRMRAHSGTIEGEWDRNDAGAQCARYPHTGVESHAREERPALETRGTKSRGKALGAPNFKQQTSSRWEGSSSAHHLRPKGVHRPAPPAVKRRDVARDSSQKRTLLHSISISFLRASASMDSHYLDNRSVL